MTDIVEQLRTEAEATAGAGDPTQSLLWRAADEIVRLRFERANALIEELEIDRLRTAAVWLRAELEHAQRMRLAAVKAVQDVVIAYDKAEAKRWRERERNGEVDQ